MSTLIKLPETKSSNCLVCLLQFSMKMAFFAVPLRGYCNHFRNEAYFERTPFAPIFFIIVNSALLLTQYITVKFTIDACGRTPSECVITSDWLSIISCSIIVINTMFCNLTSRIEELNTLTKIFECRKFYGINNLICYSCGKILQQNQKRLIFLYIIMSVLSSVHGKYLMPNPIHQFLLIVTFLIVNTQLMLIVRYKLLILRKIHNSIFKYLQVIVKCTIREYSLQTKIQRIQHLYIELYGTTKDLNDFLYPALFAWLGISTLALIFNIYVILILAKGDFNEQYFYIMGVVIFSCCILFVMVSLFSEFTKLVSISEVT